MTEPDGTEDEPRVDSFPLVARIQATAVLGEYDYDIDFPSVVEENDRLRVIYAANGSGKTNLMRAVYFLCTPDVDALQSLIDIPVRGLSVQFQDGTKITLRRLEFLEGAFSVSLQNNQTDPVSLTVSPEDFGSRFYRRTLESRTTYIQYLAALSAARSSAIFTGDDRLVLSSLPAFGSRVTEAQEEQQRETERDPYRFRHKSTQTSELVSSLRRVESAFQQMVYERIAGDGLGAGGHGVYAGIAKTIMEGSEQSVTTSTARLRLLSRSREVLTRGRQYELYGLIGLSQVRQIQHTVATARSNDRHFPQLYSIVGPYLTSISNQLDALAEVQNLIATFVESVNGFLSPKVLSFTAGHGIQLRDRRKRRLAPKSLSSGEKHLLLLLSNAVLASRTGGLMLIDEPELSLGLDWQRKLLSSLLECTHGSAVQFLVASHSVQIIGDERILVSPVEHV